MRKAVGQAVDWLRARHMNPEKSACNGWIAHDLLDVAQTTERDCYVGMQEPENFTVSRQCTGIHLDSSSGFGVHNAIDHVYRQLDGAICAAAIGDDHFGSRRALAQVRKERLN